MSRKLLVLTTSSILSIVLLIHFGFTFLYLSPENDWKDKHWNTIFAYMNPLFTQNWKLFAPDPSDQQLNMDMRVQYIDQSDKTRETDWYSITQPVIKELQHNRFSPNARFSEFQDSLINDYIWGDQDSKQTAFQSIQIYAAYQLHSGRFVVPGKVTKIQIRAITNLFPRFAERNKPDSAGKITYYPSNWWNYPTTNNGGGNKA